MMNREYILIVDDQEINRDVLRLMFEEDYHILEAEDGEECLRMISEYGDQIILVLLDLYMPKVSGIEILKLKNQCQILENTSVIVITVLDDAQSQIEALQLGAMDYIIKPFVREITEHRVRNAVKMASVMRKTEREKLDLKKKSEEDLLTGLFNKTATQHRINYILENQPDDNHVMMIIDLDDFKSVNDTYGHAEGDRCICSYADILSSSFRNADLIGRFGGDEFVVFLKSVSNKEAIPAKIEQLYTVVREQRLDDVFNTTMSIGIAYTDGKPLSYAELFKRADTALYQSKQKGKDTFTVYEK